MNKTKKKILKISLITASLSIIIILSIGNSFGIFKKEINTEDRFAIAMAEISCLYESHSSSTDTKDIDYEIEQIANKNNLSSDDLHYLSEKYQNDEYIIKKTQSEKDRFCAMEQ